MRQTTTAFLAAAVGLALAASAGAQTPSSGAPGGRPAVGINSTSVGITAPRIAGPATPAPAGNTTTTNNTPPTTTQASGNVDVRGQQTTAATAGIHASGSTSALGTLAPGSNTNGVTVTGLGVLGNGGAVNGVPIFANPSDMTAGLPATTVAAASTNGLAASDVFVGSAVTTDAQVVAVNGASVDRAINQVSRDRKRVGRNGQQLYSIAPRTNADRSHEMPDDPLPPSLTGSNSTLTR